MPDDHAALRRKADDGRRIITGCGRLLVIIAGRLQATTHRQPQSPTLFSPPSCPWPWVASEGPALGPLVGTPNLAEDVLGLAAAELIWEVPQSSGLREGARGRGGEESVPLGAVSLLIVINAAAPVKTPALCDVRQRQTQPTRAGYTDPPRRAKEQQIQGQEERRQEMEANVGVHGDLDPGWDDERFVDEGDGPVEHGDQHLEGSGA
ncbi:hypothetical protein B7494_g4378 [Chlorociboria aeruginascens]|nr:hypothetical protein B7494_g4378 [Chlorociboria aeruginascens]